MIMQLITCRDKVLLSRRLKNLFNLTAETCANTPSPTRALWHFFVSVFSSDSSWFFYKIFRLVFMQSQYAWCLVDLLLIRVNNRKCEYLLPLHRKMDWVMQQSLESLLIEARQSRWTFCVSQFLRQKKNLKCTLRRKSHKTRFQGNKLGREFEKCKFMSRLAALNHFRESDNAFWCSSVFTPRFSRGKFICSFKLIVSIDFNFYNWTIYDHSSASPLWFIFNSKTATANSEPEILEMESEINPSANLKIEQAEGGKYTVKKGNSSLMTETNRQIRE